MDWASGLAGNRGISKQAVQSSHGFSMDKSILSQEQGDEVLLFQEREDRDDIPSKDAGHDYAHGDEDEDEEEDGQSHDVSSRCSVANCERVVYVPTQVTEGSLVMVVLIVSAVALVSMSFILTRLSPPATTCICA